MQIDKANHYKPPREHIRYALLLSASLRALRGRRELEQDWEQAKKSKPLFKIQPLE